MVTDMTEMGKFYQI